MPNIPKTTADMPSVGFGIHFDRNKQAIISRCELKTYNKKN
jgi:hypothetical protein